MRNQSLLSRWFLLGALLSPLACSDAELLGTCRADMFLASITTSGDDLLLTTTSGVTFPSGGVHTATRNELLVWAKDGSEKRTLAAAEGESLWSPVADGERVVWASGNAIRSAPRAGGDEVTHVTGESFASGLAVRHGVAYYAVDVGSDAGSWLQCPNNGAIRRAPLDGGPAETLVSSLTIPPSSVFVGSDERLYWIDDFGQDVDTRDAGGQASFVGCFDVLRLVSLPVAGGPVRAVAPDVGYGLAVDESGVSALSLTGPAAHVVAFPTDGGNPVPLSDAAGVDTTNRTAVFWLEPFGEQGIYRVFKSGGRRQRMPTPRDVEAFAVDDDWIFYGRRVGVAPRTVEVWRVPLPR